MLCFILDTPHKGRYFHDCSQAKDGQSSLHFTTRTPPARAKPDKYPALYSSVLPPVRTPSGASTPWFFHQIRRSTPLMATIPNQTPTQGAQTSAGAANFKNQRTPGSNSGLTFDRHFTKQGISPYDEIVWELRDAIIQDFKGKTIFEQKNVEVPADWSMTATNIVASKYLHGLNGTAERESGVRALITRVAESIRDWGIAGGYFASQEDAETFYAELAHLLLNQKVA